MTEQEIQQELNEIARRALTHGISRPSIQTWFRSETSILAIFEGHDSITDERIYNVWHVESIEGALGKFTATLASIGSKEDRERTQYLKHIAKAIEYGKQIGIDETFINPLELQMKRLSANIIEHKKVAGDDIPF